ncbi:hypothetical protein DV711_08410 [Motiliproteus coralliicola]|uniref:Uncharacterized protein n=1 Tax=Motiliproteus coralliicola TaxID=2283196 RepID=A0A369WKL4_9GAMM|nr:hypothetical protein [Motiliproteus coralliicola]RDE22600.1 hypothetical protein DV711_08410 [Motiliproteus coralliicola]
MKTILFTKLTQPIKSAKWFKPVGAALLLVGSFSQAQAATPTPSQFPQAQSTVMEVLGDRLPMRAELDQLQQEEPQLYNEVIWELYDMVEDYQLAQIQRGTEQAELLLEHDLLSLEADQLAMEYLEAQHQQTAPAVAEYQALKQVAEQLVDLETQLLEHESLPGNQDLSPTQLASLEHWQKSRQAMRSELVQRTLDDYLNLDEELELSSIEFE